MPSERIQRQIDRILDEAEAALAKYDWESVTQHALAVQALDANNEDAQTYLEAAKRSLKGNSSSEIADDISTQTKHAPS